MGISFIALNPVAEDRAAADPAYRRELERNGKTLLSQARLLTDAELLAKLRSFGIELDKPSYLEQCHFALSAEEMSQVAVTSEVRARFRGRFDEDWIWLALTVLWERWFPGLANYEQLDDRMQLGYSLTKADSVAACEHWFLAWNDFLSLYDRGDFKSVEAFDADFSGTRFISNWVQNFETELMNAAMKDARWQRRWIEFCEQYLQQFSLAGDLTTENMPGCHFP